MLDESIGASAATVEQELRDRKPELFDLIDELEKCVRAAHQDLLHRLDHLKSLGLSPDLEDERERNEYSRFNIAVAPMRRRIDHAREVIAKAVAARCFPAVTINSASIN